MYAELHCISNFTFLRGASHPEELVARAQELGYAALAITDECSLAGVVRAHVEAKNAKDAENGKNVEFSLIIGSEFRLDDGLRLVLLATDPRKLRTSLSAHYPRPAQRGEGQLSADARRSRRRCRRLSRAVGSQART